MIPRKTQDKLAMDYPEGTRHQAKIEIALPLLGEGIPASAVEVTLKEKFPQASEREIRDVVAWCAARNPTPSTARQVLCFTPKPMATPKELVRSLLRTPSELKSPIEIHATEQAETLLTLLYGETDFINIVCKFTMSESKGKPKANPQGGGAIKSRNDWLEYFSTKGVPQSDAGAWIRPNPVKETGSGAGGAVMDSDVDDFRFLLLESDNLSVDEQLGVYAKLKLPLSVVLTSGGTSCHGWLRMDCQSITEYQEKATRILTVLASLGFDAANKNPSRLSRLPEAIRKIGVPAPAKQELMYLDPYCTGITDEQIRLLEVRVKPEKFLGKTMPEAVTEAVQLYDDLKKNKSRSGFRTGFPYFDFVTGGLKPGWLTVVAGETGAGKTTYVLNIVMNALERNDEVALFSFEMDHQEIIDLMFARQTQISRNKFNNGYFAIEDMIKIHDTGESISKYPLYVFDDPLMSMQDVFEAAERRALEGNLKLVVIDYLQLANVDQYKESREQQVAMISRTAKGMAKRLKVPVIAVSQLNEAGKVRESRAIAHDANCVIMVSENDDGTIAARVVKGRSIPRGEYTLRFENTTALMTEIDVDEHLKHFLPLESEQSQRQLTT